MNKRSMVLVSTIILASNPILSSSVVFANQENSINEQQIENTTEASLRSNEGLKSNTIHSDSNDVDNFESIESNKNLKEKNLEITGSSEQINETKENELDQTEQSGQAKEADDTDKVKKSIANKNGITASINAPNKFQTYIDPITNVGPSEITISISVSINQPDLENTFIEIPYGFTPNSENPNFKSFTMNEPIFSLIEPEIPTEDSIVDSYEERKDENKLIIHLKETKASVETLNLRFKFNQNYNAKIPADQIIWGDLKTTVKDSDGNIINESGKKNIKSSAIDGIKVELKKSNPATAEYVSGPIGQILFLRNAYNLYSLLDNTKENKVFVELPEGTIMSQSEIDYFENKPVNHKEDSSVPEGYTRYYRKLSDDKDTFPVWNEKGNINSNSRYKEPSFNVPNSIAVGDSFHIGYGMIYTKINGEQKTAYNEQTYTKIQQKDWEVYPGLTRHAENAGYQSVVDISDPSSSSKLVSTFGLTSYGYNWTFRNIGQKDVVNSAFTLYQKSEGSEKLNFNVLTIRGFKESENVTPTFYKVKFEVKNALNNNAREVVNKPKSGTFNAELPALEGNEYIDKIHIIPMGSDGISEGHLSSLNGIGISYSAKNWSDNKWPDGTEINTGNTSVVLMGATKYFDDESNVQNPVATVIEQDTASIYYSPGQVTEARAQFVSGEAKDRKPGEVVNYAVQGYNELGAISDWINPEIVISIPKQLELQNPTEYKDFIDEKDKKTYEKSVKVSLVSSDDTFNYYKFNANNIGYKNKASLSFSIPVELKVLDGTPVGSYPILAVTASHNEPSFVQLTKSTNNLPDDLAQKMGYDNSKGNSYSAYSTGNSTLNVVYGTKINGESSGRKKGSDEWSNVTSFAVDKGSTPQMKASINNAGNTTFSNVRLYDILPSVKDGRGSTGNISFAGLDDVSDATVYYTTKPISQLPNYNSNLQSWTSDKINSYGFTTAKPSEISNVTAIFIDFGEKVVEPLNSLDVVMNFLIPNADNQKAVNQFQYSAKEIGSGITLNAKSASILFSTELGQVVFDQNLPDFLPPGITDASDIPETKSVLLDIDGNGVVTIPKKTPTLAGYDFINWVDENDKKAEYLPGDEVNFTNENKKALIKLKAIWKAKKISVTYNENYGSDPKKVKKEYSFGDTVNSTEITMPRRTGYKFIGWSSSNIGRDSDFKDGDKINFLSDKVVYAVWRANNYKIAFDSNGGNGEMNELNMVYDVEKTLPKNSFVRKDYIFQGWSTNPSGTVEFKDQDAIKNISEKENSVLTLYAVWQLNKAELITKDSTIHIGDKWNPEDNFVSAKDTNGNPISFDKITAPASSEVDTSKIGDYEVFYSFNGKESKAIIHVVASQETLNIKDVTIFEGDKWSAQDNFVSAIDKDGNSVDFSKVKVTGDNGVDTKKEGVYSVTYTFDELQAVGKVTVLKNQSAIVAKDSIIYIGGHWNPVDNFVSATDKDGTSVDFSKVTGPADNSVNVSKAGDYEIVYIYNGKEAKATVHVVESQETLTVRDVTIYEGDTWTAEDNFVQATTKSGEEISFKDILVTGAETVDINKIGEYTVIYAYGDQTVVGKVTILKNQTSIKAKDSTIYTNGTWKPADNFVSATDKKGNSVPFSDISAPDTDAVNVSKVDDYEIVYTYGGKEAKVTVHVVDNQETLTVKDITIYEGETWKSLDNFVSATAKDGTSIDFKNIKVTNESEVNTNLAGIYEVTYEFGNQKEIGKVIVLRNQTNIEAKDSIIYQGSTWSPEDNFVSATNKSGEQIDFGRVTPPSINDVNTNKVGDYPIIYSYNGKQVKVVVHVVKNQETLVVKDITLYEGDAWTVKDNFVGATRKDGSEAKFSEVTVSGAETVDLSAAGVYEVIFHYGRQELVGKVIVLKNQATIFAKDSVIYLGSAWSPTDNFVGATDKAGKAISFDDIDSPNKSSVDTSKVGNYEVVYKNAGKEAKATIHVVKDLETLVVKDVTIYEGDEWVSEDNFVSATTKDGKNVKFIDVSVDGLEAVDVRKAGTYALTFMHGEISQKAKVIVLKDKSSISVKDTELYIGDKWSPKDNFISATDRKGNRVLLDDLSISGTVNTERVGTYEVTYTYKNPEKPSIAGGIESASSLSGVAKVKVLNSNNDIDNKEVRGSESKNKRNIEENGLLRRTLPNSSHTVTSSNKSYPKTGEEASTFKIIAGILVIFGVVIISWVIRKREKN